VREELGAPTSRAPLLPLRWVGGSEGGGAGPVRGGSTGRCGRPPGRRCRARPGRSRTERG
jgi:hypothetical protein